ncbi:Conserved_hypothetical protein [Hexamita inflata]|uniref:Uncharacterized protein n=1 Tax=Hexamita inflata TaxID=28002 RepID=A0AA86V766_9EUKA|nr:Conserved hypothetical protein [Hexamita inflata]
MESAFKLKDDCSQDEYDQYMVDKFEPYLENNQLCITYGGDNEEENEFLRLIVEGYFDTQENDEIKSFAFINSFNIPELQLNLTNCKQVSFDRVPKQLIHLTIQSSQLKNIDGIQKIFGLEHLYLHRNELSDLNCLSSLQTLTTLALGNNKISDISFLESLTKLQSLFLSENQISDISVLEKLLNLNQLELNCNQISDISCFVKLTDHQFSTLNLSHNSIIDISALSKIESDVLSLANNQIIDINPLKLHCTTQLSLENNKISEIIHLQQFDNIYIKFNGQLYKGLFTYLKTQSFLRLFN